MKKLILFLLLPFILSAQNNWSIKYDGGDYIRNTPGVAIYRSSDERGTISMWINADDTDNFDTFFGAGLSGSNTYFLRHRIYGDGVEVDQKNSDTETAVEATTTNLSTGTWHHVVLMSNGSVWKFYVDGTLQSKNVRGGTDNGDWFADQSQGNSLYMGSSNVPGNYFSGYIDEVSVFSDTLTPVELGTVYNGGLPYDITGFAHLEDYWRFEEGTGTTTDNEDADITLTFGASTAAPTWSATTAGWDASYDTTKWYIDADKGNDTYPGHSMNTALASFDSINTAGITLDSADVVYFRSDDLWRQTLTVPTSGVTFTKYDSTGESGADPIIDSTSVDAPLIDFNGQSYIVLENLEIRNGEVQLNTGENNIIRYCEFDSADGDALLLDGNSNSVYYNLFLNATTDAIEVDSLSNTIYNNVFYANGNGIDVDTTVTIQNNIIWTSGTSDITIAADVTVTGGHNIFEDAAKAGDGTYSGSSLWATDPLFTDAANNNFTLQASSPCINAGTSVGLTIDYLGITVPLPAGTNPDIGAYEYNQSTGYERRFPRFTDFPKFKRH